MRLENINKARFKKHLNWFQGTLVVALLLLSVGFSQLYIYLWSTGESNFWLNVAGVVTAAGLLGFVVNRIKEQPFMYEIMYVWRLKNELMRIYRHTKRLDAALAKGESVAYIIKYFHLHGSKLLYQLEDNTVTMDELNRQIREFDKVLVERHLTISAEDYEPSLLLKLSKNE